MGCRPVKARRRTAKRQDGRMRRRNEGGGRRGGREERQQNCPRFRRGKKNKNELPDRQTLAGGSQLVGAAAPPNPET